MDRTLRIREEVYEKLEASAQRRGLGDAQQLLEELLDELVNELSAEDEELARRDALVREIDAIREQIYAENGEMPDSVGLIREDRDR